MKSGAFLETKRKIFLYIPIQAKAAGSTTVLKQKRLRQPMLGMVCCSHKERELRQCLLGLNKLAPVTRVLKSNVLRHLPNGNTSSISTLVNHPTAIPSVDTLSSNPHQLQLTCIQRDCSPFQNYEIFMFTIWQGTGPVNFTHAKR